MNPIRNLNADARRAYAGVRFVSGVLTAGGTCFQAGPPQNACGGRLRRSCIFWNKTAADHLNEEKRNERLRILEPRWTKKYQPENVKIKYACRLSSAAFRRSEGRLLPSASKLCPEFRAMVRSGDLIYGPRALYGSGPSLPGCPAEHHLRKTAVADKSPADVRTIRSVRRIRTAHTGRGGRPAGGLRRWNGRDPGHGTLSRVSAALLWFLTGCDLSDGCARCMPPRPLRASHGCVAVMHPADRRCHARCHHPPRYHPARSPGGKMVVAQPAERVACSTGTIPAAFCVVIAPRAASDRSTGCAPAKMASIP